MDGPLMRGFGEGGGVRMPACCAKATPQNTNENAMDADKVRIEIRRYFPDDIDFIQFSRSLQRCLF